MLPLSYPVLPLSYPVQSLSVIGSTTGVRRRSITLGQYSAVDAVMAVPVMAICAGDAPPPISCHGLDQIWMWCGHEPRVGSARQSTPPAEISPAGAAVAAQSEQCGIAIAASTWFQNLYGHISSWSGKEKKNEIDRFPPTAKSWQKG